MYRLASFYLIASGIAALTYQVTWVRLLGLSMGSASASVSTVLAAFFLGLALGSLLAPRLTRSGVNSLKVFLWLEAAMGVSGLALLPILLNLDTLMAWVPELGRALPTKFFVTLALLAVPTICMGATFPVMAALLVRREHEVGRRLGELYSLNTLGAALGAGLAGFVFIPNLGLNGAIYLAAGINLSIALSGMLLGRHLGLPPHEADPTRPSHAAPIQGNFAALVVLAATGGVSIATEVAWTKYLGIFTGTTVFGFAAMLSIFLFGIATGSWAIRRHVHRFRAPMVWLAAGLIATCAALFYTLAGLSYLPDLYQSVNSGDQSALTREWIKYGIVFLLLFPATFLFGALFPLNLALYCGNLGGIRAGVSRAYAVNTLASISGSVAAGFFLIPEYGTDAVLRGAAWILLGTAAFITLQKIATRERLALAGFITMTAVAASLVPTLNFQSYIASVRYEFDRDAAKTEPKFLALHEGRVSVISLVTYDGIKAKLQANGLNESVIDMTDRYNTLAAESMLAYMPYFLHPNPQSAFVLGFGGGVTTQAFTNTDVKSIRVVELEPAVVQAGRALPDGPISALKDPRVKLDFDDARATLLLEKTQYDLIASQPSHPWLAGAANVFTKEFFTIVRSRLNPDGIYSQWINLFRMDVTTLRSLMKAFYDVFPYGMVIAEMETGDLIFIGSQQALHFDPVRIEPKFKRENITRTLGYKEIYSPMDLVWYFSLSREQAVQFAGDAVPNTDTNIISEIRLSGLRDIPTGNENPYTALKEAYSFDFVGYLSEENRAQNLFEFGKRFIDWKYPSVAWKILPKLKVLDQKLARELTHHALWQEHNYPAASQIFAENPEWSDATRQRQGFLHLDLGQMNEARALIPTILDPVMRVQLTARVLSEEGQWQILAKLETTDAATLKWRQLSATKLDLRGGGKALSALAAATNESEAILRTVVDYFAITDDEVNHTLWVSRLQTHLDARNQTLLELAEQALTRRDAKWAQSVLEALEEINPNLTELTRLRAELAKLSPP